MEITLTAPGQGKHYTYTWRKYVLTKVPQEYVAKKVEFYQYAWSENSTKYYSYKTATKTYYNRTPKFQPLVQPYHYYTYDFALPTYTYGLKTPKWKEVASRQLFDYEVEHPWYKVFKKTPVLHYYYQPAAPTFSYVPITYAWNWFKNQYILGTKVMKEQYREGEFAEEHQYRTVTPVLQPQYSYQPETVTYQWQESRGLPDTQGDEPTAPKPTTPVATSTGGTLPETFGAELPETGEENTNTIALLGMILAGVAMLGVVTIKFNKES
jgi:LPXTG-motif cell wall-anchored protein